MTDVLLARGGFLDDTALLRLHHAADLSVRTVEASLVGVGDHDVIPTHRSAPACLVFSAGCGRELVDDEVVTALRHHSARHSQVAFIAVLASDAGTARGRVDAAVRLLEAGADDVVSFRLDPRELSARVSATVRRVKRRGHLVMPHRADEAQHRQFAAAPVLPPELDLSSAASPLVPPSANAVGHGAVTTATTSGTARPWIDDARRELVGPIGRVGLTSKEAAVVRVLLEANAVVDRDALAQILWTGPWCGTKKAIDMHVANLRRKLPAACGGGWRIETVRGAGFVLVSAGASLSVTG